MFTTFGLVVFTRICFWKASGSRKPLVPTIFTFLSTPPSFGKGAAWILCSFFYLRIYNKRAKPV